jgi:hypothetical protein
MVKLIPGKKGSGKTKLLINAIHAAADKSRGNVVAIQIGSSLNEDINHKIRLIDAEDYKISGYDAFYGFIAGILASDYDCTDIFADGLLRIAGRDLSEVGKLFERLETICGETSFVSTISADESELTENLKKYLR